MSDIEPFSNETPSERLARLHADLTAAKDNALRAAQSDGRPTGALVPTSGNLPASQMKTQMAQHRADLIHAQAEVKTAVEKVRKEVEAQRNAMEMQMRAAMAELAPIQERVKQMEEGIWTVNLYLGRDEEIFPITDGEPAPADTPITVRQTVLFMDEETTALAEEGGMDFRKMEIFDEWLRNPRT